MSLSVFVERRDRIEYESMCSCICALSIHIYIIYIYVCVWNFWTEVKPLLLLLFQLSDGGPWALGWHGPTKTHPSCCANVPAILFSDRHGTGLSREPQPQRFYFYTVATIWSSLQLFYFADMARAKPRTLTSQISRGYWFWNLQCTWTCFWSWLSLSEYIPSIRILLRGDLP
jgi:hypothetical protein